MANRTALLDVVWMTLNAKAGDTFGRQLRRHKNGGGELFTTPAQYGFFVFSKQCRPSRKYLFHRASSAASMPARSRVTKNVRAAGREERGRPLNRVLDNRPQPLRAATAVLMAELDRTPAVVKRYLQPQQSIELKVSVARVEAWRNTHTKKGAR